MEKIICNNKIKKLIIMLFIFMLLFNFIFPNVVTAVATMSGNRVTSSIQGVVDSMRTNSNNPNSGGQTIADVLGLSQEKIEEKVAQLKAQVIQAIKDKIPDLEEELVEKAFRYYRNNQDMIEVTCNLVGSSVNGYGIGSFTVVFGDEFTKTKIETDLEGKSDEDIGDIDDDKQAETGSDNYGAGSNPDGGPTNNTNTGGSDLGGILLSPFFYLINFVVDSITETVGTIMLSEGFSLDGVWGGDILTVNKEAVPDGEEIDHKVNVSSFLLGSYQYPNIKYTPEEIFSGTIELLSIDFITGKTADGQEITNEGWVGIRKVISSWYKVLRMIAIIGLLSVLIYMGIKIILSANAKEKAKYKQWIIDWFVAVAILFAMHFIMAFIVSVTGQFSNLLGETSGKINVGVVNSSDGTVIDTFSTNLMGLVRFMIQSENFAIKVGYEVMYIMLLVYTIKFTLVYLKRVLNMAFLTLIAPIIALMYPLDKINDGNAQSFEMWLKEYIFNALLQPMHLILYYVLLGSAVGVAAANPIYGIVVLTFLTEAERLLKKIFGFEKAGGGTVGGMAGAFAAGAIASSVKNIARFGAGGSSGGGSGDNRNEALNSPKPTSPTGMDDFSTADDTMFGNNSGRNNEGDTSGGALPEGDPQEGGPLGGDPADGAIADGTTADGTAVDGTTADGTAVDGTTADGTAADGTTADGTIADGTAADGTIADRTAVDGAAADANPPGGDSPDKGKSVREMAKRFKKGSKAVGKRLLKPIWDTDKSNMYNAKRWGRRLVGAGVGITAAAVQAGISLTDGHYNPMEGFATVAAGYAGGKRIHQGVEGLWDTYQDGANAGTDKASKEAQMKRAKASYADRDDVIAFNKKNYPGKEKEAMERQREHYLTAGISDLKEMKQGMKYADKLVGNTDGLSATQISERRKNADRRAAATLEFRNTLQSQGQLSVVYNKEKRDKYIKEAAGGDAQLAKKYENAFKSLIAFNEANA